MSWVTALIITTVVCSSVRWDNVYVDVKKAFVDEQKVEESKEDK